MIVCEKIGSGGNCYLFIEEPGRVALCYFSITKTQCRIGTKIGKIGQTSFTWVLVGPYTYIYEYLVNIIYYK